MSGIYIFLIISLVFAGIYLFISNKKIAKKNSAYATELKSFESIVYHTNDALYVIEIVNGKLLHINHSAAAFLGYTGDELLKRTYFDLLPKEYLPRSAEIIADVWENKGLVFSEIPFLHKNGEVIPVECSAKIGSFDDNPAIVIYARDIRERLRYENEIKEINNALRETNKLVSEKNKEITDSIGYALRIQTAILPPQKIIKQHLGNSFILYRPKDIVAGDFYWMEVVDDLVLFAACDCTGHGVPGAMVSVICHNALNRAVREFGLTQPAAILDKTAEIVIENFSKSEEDIKDGMDISLCAYHIKTKKLEWSGANNPLWLLQNGELTETKADKQPIGMNDYSKPFINHTFNLKTGETIYLSTDGFADQFGGETGERKLTRKRFKDLLMSIQNKPMPEQGTALDEFIKDYRRDVIQIDDILVMGVKVQ